MCEIADRIDPRVDGNRTRPLAANDDFRWSVPQADLIAAADLLRSREWRKIEEAPKDGTRVLTGYWWKGETVYRVGHMNRLGNWVTDPGEWHYAPTLWVPLMEIPK